jgi:hypothetical protein
MLLLYLDESVAKKLTKKIGPSKARAYLGYPLGEYYLFRTTFLVMMLPLRFIFT